MSRVPIIALVVLAAADPGRAAEPHKSLPSSLLEPGYYAGLFDRGAARLRKVEVVEMVSTIIARGGDMGPNDGWFHPSQGRYSWKWLAARYDKNGDGKITEDEFAGPPELFERLDRDHDGKITKADFDWTERSLYVRQLMQAGGMLRALGGDNGGKITPEDWERTFRRLSKGKGFVTPEDLRDLMAPPPRPPSKEPPPDEPSHLVLLKGLIEGDLGSPFPGPPVGQKAPDFRLKTQDGTREIALSDLRGKPVVLVFGSFT
jgi:AhpC/TSA family protein/EF hand domain-containing protein